MPTETVAPSSPPAKVCTGCGELKPLDEYHRQRHSKDGHRQPCKSCRYRGKPGRSQPHRLASVDPETKTGVCRTCGPVPIRVKQRADGSYRYRCAITARREDRTRGRRVVRFRRYGLTEDDFFGFLNEQGGACAICRRDLDPESKATRIDHCHETGRVRGVLCASCNTALGLVRDDPVILRSMITYLGRTHE